MNNTYVISNDYKIVSNTKQSKKVLEKITKLLDISDVVYLDLSNVIYFTTDSAKYIFGYLISELGSKYNERVKFINESDDFKAVRRLGEKSKLNSILAF